MRLATLLLFLLSGLILTAQTDSTTKAKKIRPYLAPTLLIGSGTYLNYTKSNLNKQNLQQKILNKYPNVNTNLDDYLPFIPIGQMYLGRALGLKSKNNYFNQTKNLFFSQLFTSIITHSLKRTTQITRPDGTPHSFPSGHTSMAFSSASTLFYEYKANHPIYAASGFLFASSTAGLRVLNNRHWVSDVVVGSGVAILVTHLVYHFEPLKKFNPFKSKEQEPPKSFY
jgi:hypothetical protein